MNHSIKRPLFPSLGRCVVCQQWTSLEMWDDGLGGRFCSECFDHVVDAETYLASQGLTALGFRTGHSLGGTQLISRMHGASPAAGVIVPTVELRERRPKRATDIVTLGETDLRVTRMAIGIGTGAWSQNARKGTHVSINVLADLFEYSFEKGVRFWDAAHPYDTHDCLRLALQRVCREEVTILAKTTSTNAKDVCLDLERYLSELGTDYIDILILHCLTDSDWPSRMRPAMDAIAEAKRRGLIRSHGVSCNTLGALRSTAAEPWVEVVMARINPAGILMDSDPDTILRVLHEVKQAGKGIVGTKIFGAGRLVNRIDECLRFVLGQYCLDCFTVGIESKRQLYEVLRQTRLNSP